MYRFSLLSGLLAAPLLGCVEEALPACSAMCDAGRARWESCLTDWGVGWEAAGYADGDDWQGSCETWAWEQQLLERDAGTTGVASQACSDRAEIYASGSCEGLP